MRVKHLSISLTAIFCVLSLSLSALPKNFEPFEPGKQPPKADVTVKKIPYGVRYRGEDRICKMRFNTPSPKIVSFKYNSNDGTTIINIKSESGKVLLPPTQLTDCCPGEIIMVDINNDGTPDFIARSYNPTGCGVCWEQETLHFILSDGEAYKFARKLDQVDPGREDFFKLDNGANVMIFTRYATTISPLPEHNFYVYNLIAFTDTKLVSMNSFNRHFPAWVRTNDSHQSAIKSNHQDTDMLSGEKRNELWRNHESCSWLDSPGDEKNNELDFLAEDQKNVPKH